MYKIRNKVYADAGKILKGSSRIGYSFEGDLTEFTEIDITLDDMVREGNFIKFSNGLLLQRYYPSATYEELKTREIHKLFNNDDQIAIILNKDNSEEDAMVFQKMQEWRNWSGQVAKKILSLKGQ